MTDVMKGLYEVVQDRRDHPQEGSYICYLFEKGIDKILKKVGEECSEVIIATSPHSMPRAVSTITDSPLEKGLSSGSK